MEKVRFEAFNVEELRVLRRACYEAGAAFGDPGHTAAERATLDDLADALKMAADAADAHADNIHTKAQLANFAYKAWLIEHTEEAEKAKKTEELLTELISYGVMKGVIRNDE